MVFCEGVVLLAISRMSPTTCVSATFQLSTLVFSHLFIYLSFGLLIPQKIPHPFTVHRVTFSRLFYVLIFSFRIFQM